MTPVWQPACALDKLHLRAEVLATIRAFFAQRQVLEVETPLLASATGTDPQLDFFATEYSGVDPRQKLFLQTSPEFAMKRLLAAGSGSIYQICKAFRNGEQGRLHNPEFTMLEWYRLGFTLSELMQEVTELFAAIFCIKALSFCSEQLTYQVVFEQYTGLDALTFDLAAYTQYALSQQLIDAPRLCAAEHSLWLDFLFSHQVQPHLGQHGITLVYAYPQCQSALARLNAQDNRVAERVEVFWQGVELGNGFYELDNVVEQEQRFDKEIAYRMQQGLPAVSKDKKFLAALAAGLPECAGIALGLDRIIMLLAGNASIADVIAFPLARA